MKLLLGMLLAAASSVALAQNWVGLLKNTPAERFDEEDLRLFLDTARKALNEAPEAQTQSWNNPKTGHRGDITVRRAFEWKEHRCKELGVYSEADGRKGTSTYHLCSVEGRWRLLSPSQVKKK